jgi:hypothetical protein
VFPVKKMTHKKVTLAKVTAKNDPPESTRQAFMVGIPLADYWFDKGASKALVAERRA